MFRTTTGIACAGNNEVDDRETICNEDSDCAKFFELNLTFDLSTSMNTVEMWRQ